MNATTANTGSKSTKSTKRKYTARNTTVVARRVVLTNGKPAGRGKPSLEGKSKRTFVFLPLGVKYDAAKHGPGKKYMPHAHGSKVFIRMPVAEAVKLGAKAPKVTATVKAKAVRAKIKANKTAAPVAAPVVAPVADVETPAATPVVEAAPSVSADASAALTA